MLKHILAGQPSSAAGSRLHQHHDFLASTTPPTTTPGAAGPGLRGGPSPLAREPHFLHAHPGLLHAPQAQPRGLGGAVRAQSSADVYDSLGQHGGGGGALGQRAGPQLGHRHHPLNHSQLSVNNLAQRLNASQHGHGGLNLSTLSTSKHSVNSASPVVGAHLANYSGLGPRGAAAASTLAVLQQQQQQLAQHAQQHQAQQQQQQLSHTPLDRSKMINGGLDISRMSRGAPGRPTPSPAGPATATAAPTHHQSSSATASAATTATTMTSTGGPSILPLNASWTSSSLSAGNQKPGPEAGVKEMLTSLGLLCLVSLLLALLSLTFLVRISSVAFPQPVPNGLISVEEFAIVYDVTLVLCALALSLNLCCLLVCAIQFLFAVKLVKTSYHGNRTNKYLQKSSISRVCAVGGFFISIPVFLTGMILYTFIQFQSTPAIVTSVFIGVGIVFCGCALVHTVFVWQKEKTNAMKAMRREQYEAAAQLQRQQAQHQQLNQNQTQHQQQQQPSQSHHQHQQQSRSIPTPYGVASRLANNGAEHQLPPSGALSRGLSGSAVAGPQQQQTQQQSSSSSSHHQSHRHIPAVSPPPLLLSSSNGLLHSHQQQQHHNHHHQNHQQHNQSSHHGGGPLNASLRGPANASLLLGPASPPASPGDRSPTSPANRHNRSHHQTPSQPSQSREAAGSVSPGLPAATLDLSSAANTSSPHELSTLV